MLVLPSKSSAADVARSLGDWHLNEFAGDAAAALRWLIVGNGKQGVAVDGFHETIAQGIGSSAEGANGFAARRIRPVWAGGRWGESGRRFGGSGGLRRTCQSQREDQGCYDKPGTMVGKVYAGHSSSPCWAKTQAMVRLNKSQCFGSGAGAGRRSSLTRKTGNCYSKTGWILAPKARASRALKAAGKVGHLAILALPKGQDGGAQTTRQQVF